MSTIFSKIIKGETPCYKVAESENCLAFLDINPLSKGHCLVIPKKEVNYIFDLDNDLFIELQLFSKTIAKKMEKVITCERIGVVVIGLEVPHAHIHLVPINSVYDIDFSKPRVNLTREEFEDIAQKIANAK